MDDELKEDGGRAEDLAVGLLTKALAEAGLETQDGEEPHEQDEPGIGGKSLLLELDLREGVGLTANGRSARLHRADLLVACVWVSYLFIRAARRKVRLFFQENMPNICLTT